MASTSVRELYDDRIRTAEQGPDTLFVDQPETMEAKTHLVATQLLPQRAIQLVPRLSLKVRLYYCTSL